ncbi:MAG: HAMP domain-containing sensor histidine kinase [Bacteroidota bacterium]|nr:HAMP domain-containing sensor histidine kinase [Bacteroidota bacterium]
MIISKPFMDWGMSSRPMKLLTKTTLKHLIFSLLIFFSGGIAFYGVVSSFVFRQIDETLIAEREIIEEQIDHLDSIPDFSTVFGHHIEVTLFNHYVKPSQKFHDTILINAQDGELEHYRHLLITNNTDQHKSYSISIFKSLSETRQLMQVIFLIVFCLSVILLISLTILNYSISKRLWVPFYDTLSKMQNYSIEEKEPLSFPSSTVIEFNQLNNVVRILTEKIRADYLNLKEFTENASHEIQTPLAIIKSKLELLIQTDNLDKKQINEIKSIYEATNRLSKLNYALLLITKIQNQQFTFVEPVCFNHEINRLLLNFEDIISQKKIKVSTDYNSEITLNINPDLAEILLNNLLSNAIKHNVENGTLDILLNKAGLVISNTGPQLDVDPKLLFQRFRKANSSGSLGLGLSIVQKIAVSYKMNIDYSLNNKLHIVKIDFPANLLI